MRTRQNTTKKLYSSEDARAFLFAALDGIPLDIRAMFVPETDAELDQFIQNTIRFLSRENNREKVMRLQKLYNLSMDPNESLRHLLVRIRVLELKDERKKLKD